MIVCVCLCGGGGGGGGGKAGLQINVVSFCRSAEQTLLLAKAIILHSDQLVRIQGAPRICTGRTSSGLIEPRGEICGTFV